MSKLSANASASATPDPVALPIDLHHRQSAGADLAMKMHLFPDPWCSVAQITLCLPTNFARVTN